MSRVATFDSNASVGLFARRGDATVLEVSGRARGGEWMGLGGGGGGAWMVHPHFVHIPEVVS